MFLMMWIWYFVSLTNIIHALRLYDMQDKQFERFKRKNNETFETTNILSNEYDKKYPFIVRIKSVHLRTKAKTFVTCMGTLINANMVLTTAICVRGAMSIKVILMENIEEDKLHQKEYNIQIVPLSSAINTIERVGERKIFPNPLFYGDQINRYHEWYNPFPKSTYVLSNTSERNLAMIYLNRSRSEIFLTDMTFPVIVTNPTAFMVRDQPSYLLKWNFQQINNNSFLTMVKVDFSVFPCDKDIDASMAATTICVSREIYKNNILEEDQGSPLALYTYDRDKNTTTLPLNMSLIAMINTAKSDGKLIYLWSYKQWIVSVLNEFESLPEPDLSCGKGSTENSLRRWMHANSYYDTAEGEKRSKMIVPCSNSLAVFATTGISSLVVLAAAAAATAL